MCKITFSGNLQFAFYTLQEGGFSYTHIVYTQSDSTSTHPAWAHQRAANIDTAFTEVYSFILHTSLAG